MVAPSPRRLPLNFFAIAFGLCGLAECWVIAGRLHLAPVAVANVLIVLAAAVWVATVALYARFVLATPGALSRDLCDGIAGPFASLAVISPMLLAANGLYPYAPTAGRIVVDVFLVLTVALGAWFTGQWIYGPLEFDQLHPGYFLPTVAGGFIASGSAALVGQHLLAEVLFGFGLICWLVVGSMILTRLLVRPPLPPPLMPTLAIEVAPAAVGTLAYLAINGGHIDAFAAALGGYGLLMVLAQIRLVPAYARLPFMPSFWAFTFAWASVASCGLEWLHDTSVVAPRAYSYVLLALITGFIGAIAVRTVLSIARGEFLPRLASVSIDPAGSPASEPDGAATAG